jgi:ElaA protein
VADSVEDKLTVHDVTGDRLTPEQLYAVLRLRVDVFVVEQECPYPEIDGRDLLTSTRHLWLDGPDGVASYLRVLEESAGARRIGRVATARAARGQGLAAQLMKAALAHAGGVDCVLDSQTYAKGFYAKFGFVPEGDEFIEDGIPHITMWRRAQRMSGMS